MLLTYWAALAFVSRRAAVLAALMMASSLLLGVEARLAKTDAMLLLTVVAAMGALAAPISAAAARGTARTPHPWRRPAIFWTALAAGVLLKGPLILMFVGLTAAALVAIDRSARWLLRAAPAAGVAWLLLLVLPWFVAIVLRSGDSFFAESIGQDLFAKVGSGQESHGAPPGNYLRAVLGDVLSRRDAGRPCGAGGLARRAGARREIPAGLARAVLDRVRARGDQAAALRAAALSGDRDPDRRRGRQPRAVAAAAGSARHRVVVPHHAWGSPSRRWHSTS